MPDAAERVRLRAIRYFKVGAERRTSGRTGVLIYLSIYVAEAKGFFKDEGLENETIVIGGPAAIDRVTSRRMRVVPAMTETFVKERGSVLGRSPADDERHEATAFLTASGAPLGMTMPKSGSWRTARTWSPWRSS